MTLTTRQPFPRGGKFVVNKAFRFAGHAYSVGDVFPWRQLSCAERRARQLYEGRYIRLSEDDEVPDTSEDETLVGGTDESGENQTDESDEDSEDDESDEESDEESADEDEGPITIFDPEVHEIVADGAKRYICLDGERLVQVTKREAKRLNLLRKPAEINMEQVIEEEE